MLAIRDQFTHTYRPNVVSQFKFAENPETRRRAQEGHESRLQINVPLLSKALDLRRRIAKLLEYDTWYGLLYISFDLRTLIVTEIRADYITEVKMIKTSKGVVEVCFWLPSMKSPDLTVFDSSSMTWIRN